MNQVKVTLAVGFALVIAMTALVLTRSPPRIARVSVPVDTTLGVTFGEPLICQANEVLPAETSAVRLSLIAFFGSNVHVIAYRGARVVSEGRRGANWTGSSVTVPITPVDRTLSHVKLCFELAPNSERVIINGGRTPPQQAAIASQTPAHPAQERTGAALPLKGRVSVEYLTPGRGSWWSRALTVARHVGIGHLLTGTWVVLLIAALMAAVGALALRVALREIP